MITIKFVTTHRLDPEKGWDLILNWLRKELLNPAADYRIEFDIYGQGKMQDEIEALAKQYPESIRYHGFVSIHEIYAWKMDYDFVMMPSRFLETFGLSALDFAQFGIPTIGYKKGGAVPFVSDNLDIGKYEGATEQEQFDNAMESILKEYSKKGWKNIEWFTIDKDQIIKTYGIWSRLRKFEEIIW